MVKCGIKDGTAPLACGAMMEEGTGKDNVGWLTERNLIRCCL